MYEKRPDLVRIFIFKKVIEKGVPKATLRRLWDYSFYAYSAPRRLWKDSICLANLGKMTS